MRPNACNLKSDVGTTKMQAMNKYNWGGIGLYWIDTTELEIYKQVEPRGGGKKLGSAKKLVCRSLGAIDRNPTRPGLVVCISS